MDKGSPPGKNFSVPGQFAGMRLDAALALLLGDRSRAAVQKLVKAGLVTLNATPVLQTGKKVSAGDTLSLAGTEAEPARASSAPLPEEIALSVIYEDEILAVIDKPPNFVVHPGAGNTKGTLVNALLARYPEFSGGFSGPGAERPGIVHRLDKDTSGCLIIAKTQRALTLLSEEFSSRIVKKTYYAIVKGHPAEKEGKLVTLIGRSRSDRKKMAVLKDSGREAITLYRTISETPAESSRQASLLEINILTGRTHQIRVHLAFLGCPVAGDTLYGGKHNFECARQMLHAGKITFRHPLTGDALSFRSPFPEDFRECAESLCLNLPGEGS